VTFPRCALAIVLAGSFSCSDTGEPPGPGPTEVEPVKKPEPTPEPVFRDITRDGARLFDKSAPVVPPVKWKGGGIEAVFVAVKEVEGGYEHARIRATQDGQKPVEVLRCAGKDFAGALFVSAYLDSAKVAFVVCESPHSKDQPGRSVGVRLAIENGIVAKAGDFENEGPPAYDTMDFTEGEHAPE